jgi:hypothetical protein
MYELESDIETRPPTATKRYRRGEIPGQREQAQRIIDTMGNARPRRAAQNRHDEAPRGDVYEGPQGPQRRRADEQAPNTREDRTIQAPRTRTAKRAYTPAPSQKPKRQKQPKHPLVYVGATAAAFIGFIIAGTSGAAWWSTAISDPGVYGPTHGTIASAVLGGGDSKEHSTKIIGWNNGGKVELIIMHANDPAKMQAISGPDLTAVDFPDPINAEVYVEAGDFNHDGKQDIKIIIYATTFDMPFHRYNRPSILDGDGKGGLKLQQQTGGQ